MKSSLTCFDPSLVNLQDLSSGSLWSRVSWISTFYLFSPLTFQMDKVLHTWTPNAQKKKPNPQYKNLQLGNFQLVVVAFFVCMRSHTSQGYFKTWEPAIPKFRLLYTTFHGLLFQDYNVCKKKEISFISSFFQIIHHSPNFVYAHKNFVFMHYTSNLLHFFSWDR